MSVEVYAFWIAAALIVYTYIGFPLLVFLRNVLCCCHFHATDATPQITLVIAAYNEQESIEAKLQSVLQVDYPRERLEIVVASDGSTDRTEEIVRRYESRGVRLLALPRRGKAATLNAAVESSGGEILVFSDANSIFAEDTLRQLVRPFADPAVGGVAGDQRYSQPKSTGLSGDGERGYWNFERWLKQSQSRAGNVTSATGALYAIRRSQFANVPEGVTDDFAVSTRVIQQGFRLVFAPAALAFEPVAASGGAEFARKVRVITRGLRGVLLMRGLLNPWRYGFYSVQLFSHKVLRRLVVFPLLAMLPLNIALWQAGMIYRAALAVQLLVYGAAAAGWILRNTAIGRKKCFAVPFFFCLVNAACLIATFKLIVGQRIVVWEPQRPGGQHAVVN